MDKTEMLTEAYRRLDAADKAGDTKLAQEIAADIQEIKALSVEQGPSDLQKYGPGFVKESLGNVVRGAERLNTQAETAPHPLVTAVQTAKERLVGPTKKLAPEPGAPADNLWRRVTEGAGEGMVIGGPLVGGARGLYSGAVSGGAGAGGSWAGQALAKALDPKGQNSWLSTGLSLFGGLAGGFLGSAATGPSQSLAHKELRIAQRGMTPQDYVAMEQRLAQARDSGSTSYMLVDAVPDNSPLKTLTSSYGSVQTHNPLREGLVQRPEDLQRLGNTTVARTAGTQQPVSPAGVALSLENSSARAVDNLNDLRGTSLANRLAGRVVSDQQFSRVEDAVDAWGVGQPRTTAQEAARRVLQQLRQPDGSPIRDVQQLSLAIKELKAAAPGIEAATAQKITAGDLRAAIRVAEEQLARESRAFREGMADFRGFSQQVIAPVKQGPIGAVADKRPFVDDPASPTVLNRFTSGQTPQAVEQAGRTVGDPNLTQFQPTDPRQVAAAIIQQRLNKGSMDPGATVRGLPGSREEQNLAALIRAGNGNPSYSLAPLAVADDLQGLQNLGLTGPPVMHGWQAMLRPFRTIDMGITRNFEERAAEEIARIMASRDPAMIRRLQEIAMFQPVVRRLIGAYSGIVPAGRETQE